MAFKVEPTEAHNWKVVDTETQRTYTAFPTKQQAVDEAQRLNANLIMAKLNGARRRIVEGK